MDIATLRSQIRALEAELIQLRHKLHLAEQAAKHSYQNPYPHPLPQSHYERYTRQLLVPSFGVSSQLALCQSSILIIGLGGLGCPAAAYLAAAGVGRLGLLDGDIVELSNLHRQTLHSMESIGLNKARSAEINLRKLNPTVEYTVFEEFLTPQGAVGRVKGWDLVLDCTDTVGMRYLINDACVVADKPLVSAAALRTEGSVVMLNSLRDGERSPCYRCLYPTMPPRRAMQRCSEAGVLGPVVGVMGTMQALEAIKVVTGRDTSSAGTMLLFSGYEAPQFRTVRVRKRKRECVVHGRAEVFAEENYVVPECEGVGTLREEDRISAKELGEGVGRDPSGMVLVDIRPETEFDMCRIEGAVNIPWTGDERDWVRRLRGLGEDASREWVVICKRGNDSQMAVSAGLDVGLRLKDVSGGLEAWRREVDPTWPVY
ncbi:hypothetical protein K470DRAFT_213535 [Piedraia hortae CBS 480.64]|uniref:Rhodanese domain-containing protein n=1 Tax=Piedraia hortae CBS 480.64 TaxID=1314780 RepID=A0A6A7C3S6_9PEZI|nr:hypothetical protein K470DRAFT_213535 [Piedraia hortae CBS 480.64]